MPAGREAPAATVTVESSDDARRAIYHSLRSAHATVAAGESARTLRFDIGKTPLAEAFDRGPHRPGSSRPHNGHPQGPQPGLRPSAAVASRKSVSDDGPRTQVAAWLIGAVGASAIGLGIGLGGWSLIGDRPELWNPALAAAIGGQGLLIVGLMQLLASLWNAARAASGKLSLMHDELRRLRRHADDAAGRNHATAAAFYADLARDASPDQMVGNLRGQLDQLASRLR